MSSATSPTTEAASRLSDFAWIVFAYLVAMGAAWGCVVYFESVVAGRLRGHRRDVCHFFVFACIQKFQLL